MDESVRKAIAESGRAAEIRRAAEAAGMKPMLHSGLAKAAAGITSVEEVLRVVPPAAAD